MRISTRTIGDCHASFDRHRHDRKSEVIDMFANQIGPSGDAQQQRLTAVQPFESCNRLFGNGHHLFAWITQNFVPRRIVSLNERQHLPSYATMKASPQALGFLPLNRTPLHSIAAAVCALSAVFLLASCNKTQRPNAAMMMMMQAAPVRVVSAVSQDVPLVVSAVGTVEA